MAAKKKTRQSQLRSRSAKSGAKEKNWGGRFGKAMSRALIDFNASIDFDKRLAQEDIAGSIAHGQMLAKIGVLSSDEIKTLVKALNQISHEIQAGQFVFRKEAEDIHMNIESRLTEICGDLGKKIHTGRSRNDQVALDTRLFTRNALDQVLPALKNFAASIVEKAEKNVDTLLPGYTHLQRAQAVSLAHHLLAYFEMFMRDAERLKEIRARLNRQMPLGSGAIAGTTLPLDREQVMEQLRFDGMTQNSMDAVSDRDYIIEFASASALIMMHLSRLCEEWILWSTQEFSFVDIDESLCTGSSMMPQKKNPDVPELVRGKCARVYGNLMTLLALTKSLPLAYNKDLQEDKEPLFDTFDTVKASLEIMKEVMVGTTFNVERMREVLEEEPVILATDVAEYLVSKGVPFRNAHEIVGRTVRYCLEKSKTLPGLTLDEFQSISKEYDQGVFEILSISHAVDRRKLRGGTGRETVRQALREARTRLKAI